MFSNLWVPSLWSKIVSFNLGNGTLIMCTFCLQTRLHFICFLLDRIIGNRQHQSKTPDQLLDGVLVYVSSVFCFLFLFVGSASCIVKRGCPWNILTMSVNYDHLKTVKYCHNIGPSPKYLRLALFFDFRTTYKPTHPTLKPPPTLPALHTKYFPDDLGKSNSGCNLSWP